MSFGDAGLDYALEQSLRQQAGPTPGKAFLSEFLAGLAPGAGMADAAGGFPNMQEGGTYPGWRENLADGNYGMAGMQGLGALGDLLTFAGPMGLAAGAVARAPGAAVRGATAAKRAKKGKASPQDATTTRDPAVLGYDPDELSVRYPNAADPVETVDPKTGRTFLKKQQSPEAEAVGRVRKQAQQDINAGNYEPHFRVDERYNADSSRYPLSERTEEVALPKMQKTTDRWRDQFDTPEVRQRLGDAYTARANDPLSQDWYAMGQLEDEFIRELGPELGPQAFRQRFSQPMAATTGGADPTGNLLMANYGNYLQTHGQAIPSASYGFPYPVGGRFATGNMGQYDKIMNQGGDLSLMAGTHPKRHNFSANFEGHLDRSTIDEQMMRAVDPTGTLKAPPGDSYGVIEGIVNSMAHERGTLPANFQGVAWTGLKDAQGRPMIQVFNEAIERTRRVTGKDPQEIVRDFIHGRAPLYGVTGGALGLGAMLSGEGAEQQSLVPES